MLKQTETKNIIQFPENLDRVSSYLNSSIEESNSLIDFFKSNEKKPLSFNEISSLLEDEAHLRALIVYLNSHCMENPNQCYFLFNLLSQIMEQNQNVTNSVAKLENLRRQEFSFDILKLKMEKILSHLMPDATFFKLLTAHNELLNALGI